jgi:hypothetical protein
MSFGTHVDTLKVGTSASSLDSQHSFFSTAASQPISSQMSASSQSSQESTVITDILLSTSDFLQRQLRTTLKKGQFITETMLPNHCFLEENHWRVPNQALG